MGAATELYHLEWKSLSRNGLLAVFLDELAVECEALSLTVEGDGCALVGGGSYGSLNNGTYRILLLNCVPRIRYELLVAEAELVGSLIELKDNYIDGVTRSNDF